MGDMLQIVFIVSINIEKVSQTDQILQKRKKN